MRTFLWTLTEGMCHKESPALFNVLKFPVASLEGLQEGGLSHFQLGVGEAFVPL